ncbi:hypothetical protein EU971_18285 [Yersinia pseudotuberculosis]|nr:hypothetical protein [Yersinia pseudotuberculosis]RYC20477.1 hypothetical protein EU971_18285 [Yersinia pseudotuberculosis]
MPVSVVGVKISKTGNYTILFTVSWLTALRLQQHIFPLSDFVSRESLRFPQILCCHTIAVKWAI